MQERTSQPRELRPKRQGWAQAPRQARRTEEDLPRSHRRRSRRPWRRRRVPARIPMAQPAQTAESWEQTRTRALGARARSGACPWQEHRQGCRSAARGPWPGRMTWVQARQRAWTRGSEQPVWARRVQSPTGSVPLPVPLLAASRWRSRMQGPPRTRVAGPQMPQPVQMENAPHVEEPA